MCPIWMFIDVLQSSVFMNSSEWSMSTLMTHQWCFWDLGTTFVVPGLHRFGQPLAADRGTWCLAMPGWLGFVGETVEVDVEC